MKKFIFAFLLVNMLIFPAYSKTCVGDLANADCTTEAGSGEDCAELGYSKVEVAGCTKYILCPFNTDYKACVANVTSEYKDCIARGYNSDDKSSWCVKDYIITCPYSKDMTACTKVSSRAFSCENLGFTEEDKSSWCPAERIFVCPQNEKLTMCADKELNCADLGFTDTDKNEWCGNIVTCKNDSSLTLCAGPCEYASEDACASVPGNICKQSGESGEGCWFLDSCDEGYELKDDKCEVRQCEADYNTELTFEDCKSKYSGEIGLYLDEQGMSGEKSCKKCVCEPEETKCQYTNTDNKYEKLSGPCCNDKYNSCTPNFPKDIDAVEHVKEYEYTTYTACGEDKDIKTGIKDCDDGYIEHNAECVKFCDKDIYPWCESWGGQSSIKFGNYFAIGINKYSASCEGYSNSGSGSDSLFVLSWKSCWAELTCKDTFVYKKNQQTCGCDSGYDQGVLYPSGEPICLPETGGGTIGGDTTPPCTKWNCSNCSGGGDTTTGKCNDGTSCLNCEKFGN